MLKNSKIYTNLWSFLAAVQAIQTKIKIYQLANHLFIFSFIIAVFLIPNLVEATHECNITATCCDSESVICPDSKFCVCYSFCHKTTAICRCTCSDSPPNLQPNANTERAIPPYEGTVIMVINPSGFKLGYFGLYLEEFTDWDVAVNSEVYDIQLDSGEWSGTLDSVLTQMAEGKDFTHEFDLVTKTIILKPKP